MAADIIVDKGADFHIITSLATMRSATCTDSLPGLTMKLRSTPPLIDIGANLTHESFRHDLDEVMQRAHAAGVELMLVTGSSLHASEQALALARAHDELFATAGIHPHEASSGESAEVMQAIAQLAREPQVRAIGETGLDFNRDYSPRPVQEKVFAEHLAMASELGKPVFLHQRDAHERFLPMLKEYRDHLCGGVVHCFTDSRRALHDYLDLDMYIGVTGWICDERRGKELQTLVRDIPENRLLLETDAPYLMPRTLRPRPKTRRNEPVWLSEVLRMVAQCRQADEHALATSTSDNARRLFQLPG